MGKAKWLVEPILGTDEYVVVDRDFFEKIKKKAKKGYLSEEELEFVQEMESLGFAMIQGNKIYFYIGD